MIRNPDWGRPACTLIFVSVCSQGKGTFGAKKSPNDPMIFNASFFQAISKLPILWHPDLPAHLTWPKTRCCCGSFWVQCWELMADVPGEVLTQAISAGVEVNDVEKCLPWWFGIVTSSDGSNPGETFQIDWYWRLVKYHQIQLDASSGESMCKGGGSNNLSTMESKDVGMLKHFSISLGHWTFLDLLHFSVQFGHNYNCSSLRSKDFKPRRLTQVKDSKSWRYNGTISSQWRSLLLVQYISNYKTKTRWWQLK